MLMVSLPPPSLAFNRSSLLREHESVFRAKSGNTGLPGRTGILDSGKTDNRWFAQKLMTDHVTRLENICLKDPAISYTPN